LHFGVISPPVAGHIHPFGALGRELMERGHRVSFMHMPDVADRIRREGLEFIPIGHADHPKGSLAQSLTALGQMKGLRALRFTIAAVAGTTEMMLRDAPLAIADAGISALLADQMEPAGGTIAEHLGIPFVTVCNALAINREPHVPPAFTPWRPRETWWAHLRNSLGYAASDRLTQPISRVVNRYRRAWNLKALDSPDDSFSPLAQISQQPALFDFPRRRLPAHFHYVGPLRKPLPAAIPFPWERLDGRPLIYASLGTLQNSRFELFRCFAEACRELDAQLVITHGGGLTDAESSRLPGNPLVVAYAPQREVMARARLTLTHAGLNTVLDSLTFGVPLVAVPITYEQPAIAERVRRLGAGEAIPLAGLNAHNLREIIRRVLSTDSYLDNARRVADAIREAGGVGKAADIVIDAIR